MARIQNRYILRDGATADVQPRNADLWSGTEEHLAVARLNNGSVIEVWDHWEPGAHRLFGRMVSASGAPVGAVFPVSGLDNSPQGVLGQFHASVAAMGNGGFFVTWTAEEYNGGYNTGRNVLGRLFDASGHAQGDAFLVGFERNAEGGLATGSWEHRPMMATLSDGRVAVAFVDDMSIMTRVYDASGTATQSSRAPIDDLPGRPGVPDIAALSNGGFVVSWENELAEGGHRISIQRYAGSGAPVGPVIHPDNPAGLARMSTPRICGLENGGFVVSWSDWSNPSVNSYTTLQVYDAHGVAVSGNILMRPVLDSQTGSTTPDLVALPDGGFVAVYSAAVVKYGNIYADDDIYVQRFAADGTRLGDFVRANPGHVNPEGHGSYINDGNQIQPEAALLDNGRLFVSWFDQAHDSVRSTTLALARLNVDGTDRADFIAYGNAAQHRALRAGADRATGGTGNDTISAGTGHDTVQGGAGHDSLMGDDGNDQLFGDGGADTLRGGNGTDRLEGNLGNDSLVGGNEADTLLGGDGNDRLEGGTGADTLLGGDGADTLIGGDGANRLEGNGGDDRLIGDLGAEALLGGYGRDSLEGSGGNDRLSGDSGADTLRGGYGHDRVEGGSDADRLYGGNGSDTVSGGGGRDVLAGGAGADVFVFRTPAETGRTHDTCDVITDFQHADADRLDLSDIDANAQAAGDQRFHYIGAHSFGGAAGEVRCAGGVVAGDVDGDRVADFRIELSRVTSLQADDFIL